ncbi:DndE family protein [uncultured Draconibacterium sp.]|uniref:DndE family protein n=1 Tax=uncultured Draconibacterium sp. TaxID=1573823 RepID=UPI002AA68B07|nr:DndE family protein [uncultured Draconibacterium sp.]
MLSHIRTSKANKEIVQRLTRKLNLGTENIIARIAFSYSLSKGQKLDLKDMADSGGKEYSKNVFFGENYDIYTGLLIAHYRLHQSHNDLPKYLKMHVDDGLVMLDKELSENPNIEGFEFLADKIEGSLKQII